MFTLIRTTPAPRPAPVISTTYHLRGVTNWTHCGVWPDGVRHTDQPASIVRGMHLLGGPKAGVKVCPTCLIAANQPAQKASA